MANNASRAQDYLMQIVSAGYGFDVPDIQSALTATNYKSVEDAVAYLFQQQSAKQSAAAASSSSSNTNTNSKSSSSATSSSVRDMASLKERISAMEIDGNMRMDVNDGILSKALSSTSSTGDALNFIMDKYAHLIQPADSTLSHSVNNKSDAQRLKAKLKEDAQLRRTELAKAEKQRIVDQNAAAKEHKRLEQAKAEKKRQNQARIVLNRQKAAKRKKKEKESHKASTLAWHKRHEAYDDADVKAMQQMEASRAKHNATLQTPDAALKLLCSRYGEEAARATMAVLRKVISNVVSHPNEAKYRRLSLQNAKLKVMLVPFLGALKFLQFVGFEVVTEVDPLFPNDEFRAQKFVVLSDNKLNVKDCRQALSMLDQFSAVERTFVFALTQHIIDDAETKMTSDELYFALMDVRRRLQNICISPASQHLRVIEVDDLAFRRRTGRFRVFQKVLKKLGFSVQKQMNGKVFVMGAPNLETVAWYRKVVRDLEAAATEKVLKQTTLAVSLAKIYGVNAEKNELARMWMALNKAMTHILEEPLNMKYHTINAKKLKGLFKEVNGVVSSLKLLGFKKKKEDKSKFVLGAEYDGDLDLLRCRRDLFVKVTSSRKLLMPQQNGQPSAK